MDTVNEIFALTGVVR